MPGDDLYPPFLKHRNISRIEGNALYITDRRKLPFSHEEVACRSASEAASAIKDMVTQGGGPLEVALNALLLTYRNGDDVEEAVRVLAASRPTNTTMSRTLYGIMERYRSGEDVEELVAGTFSYYDRLYDAVSDTGSSLISDGDGILTRCFPEHTFLLSVYKAARDGRRAVVYVPETRPYLQGARLTEPSLRALGIECYLITDAMNAHLMAEGKVDKVMTAADLVLSDRTVVNKVGTLSDAVAARYYGIPYYAFCLSPDTSRTADDIVMEERDGEEVKRMMGVRTASDDAMALYPAFDMIRPELVSGIITREGVI